MPKRLEVYKCEACGNIVEVMHGGAAALVCCGQKMKLMAENSVDAATEKHVPVIEFGEGSITVKVGSVAHPMEEAHYIEWVEVIDGDKAYREFLKPAQAPEATFCIEGGKLTAREYCNVHGLWRGGEA